MKSFRRIEGRYDGQPVAAASTPSELILANQTHRQIRRSREQGCSHQGNHRGIRATASIAHDPPPQRSASSIPPQNHERIIAAVQRFHTARVKSGKSQMEQIFSASPSEADVPAGKSPRPGRDLDHYASSIAATGAGFAGARVGAGSLRSSTRRRGLR